MNVIGANFSNAVTNINTPGYWQGDVKLTMFVPDANESMSDAELQTNYNELQIRIEAWERLKRATYWNSTSHANMDFIISTYQAKQIEYQYLIESRKPQTTTTETTTGPNGEVITTEKKPNWGLYLVGGAALIYFILKKNKKIK